MARTERTPERAEELRRGRLKRNYTKQSDRTLAVILYESITILERYPDDPVKWDTHGPMIETARAELVARRAAQSLVSVEALVSGEVALEIP